MIHRGRSADHRRARCVVARRPAPARRRSFRSPCSTRRGAATAGSSSSSRDVWRRGRQPGGWPSSPASVSATSSGTRPATNGAIGPATRVEVLTEGVLTRRLQNDPELPGVAAVIFDEVHERNLTTDLGLALTLEVGATLRPDLRILAMSATADTARFARLLAPPGGAAAAPVVDVAGRAHPVEVRWLPRRRDERLEGAVERAVVRALSEDDGDILVFLPGIGEILRCRERLVAMVGSGVDVRPLAGALSTDEQDLALAGVATRPAARRPGDRHRRNLADGRRRSGRRRQRTRPRPAVRRGNGNDPVDHGLDQPRLGRSARRPGRADRARRRVSGCGRRSSTAAARRTAPPRSPPSISPASRSRSPRGVRRSRASPFPIRLRLGHGRRGSPCSAPSGPSMDDGTADGDREGDGRSAAAPAPRQDRGDRPVDDGVRRRRGHRRARRAARAGRRASRRPRAARRPRRRADVATIAPIEGPCDGWRPGPADLARRAGVRFDTEHRRPRRHRPTAARRVSGPPGGAAAAGTVPAAHRDRRRGWPTTIRSPAPTSSSPPTSTGGAPVRASAWPRPSTVPTSPSCSTTSSSIVG